MSKEKAQTGTKPVGANCVRQNFKGMTKNKKGITLIALVITIIVMLILVGVSVTVALNGGLFKTAKSAADQTTVEKDREHNLSKGEITIKGETYDSYYEYAGVEGGPEKPKELVETTRPEGWSTNVVAYTDGKNTVPVPNGYQISDKEGEKTIFDGLVIKDSNNNEFVWIPVVKDFTKQYSHSYSEKASWDENIIIQYECSEPAECLAKDKNTSYNSDTQENLNQYYGEGYYDYPETEVEKADVNNDFAYKAHYEEMVDSVNKYDGFYVGRYETTNNNGKIGSAYNATLISATAILKTGNSLIRDMNTGEYQPFYSRWWGLYEKQRNADAIVGNGTAVQTNMIWGQQWDAMIARFDALKLDYSETPVLNPTEKKLLKSGQAEYSYEGETIKDKIYNIYDLRGSTNEWTAEQSKRILNGNETLGRFQRGGQIYRIESVSRRGFVEPGDLASGSRLTLYIK